MNKDQKGKNPFLDDDDDEVDDYEFLNHPQQGQSGYILGNNTFQREQSDWEIKRMQLLEERRSIQERTLQSTNTSLGLLHESEQVGILTAEELVKQREQLDNIEENLDVINSTMRTSQKHINSLKSIFGGIKNYFSKSGATDSTTTIPADLVPPKKSPSSNLHNTLDILKADSKESEGTHPAFRVRDLPYDDIDSYNPEASKEKARAPPMSTNSSDDFEDRLDKNIEHMSLGLGRLKSLAIGLNTEIEQQNEKIDLIHNKVDKADETLEHQNRQIKRILKK